MDFQVLTAVLSVVAVNEDTAVSLGVSFMSLLGVTLTAVLAYKSNKNAAAARREANQVNAAVNNRMPGEPTLKEQVQWLVQQQIEFQSKGWPSLPDHLATGPHLSSYLDGLEDKIRDSTDMILKELRDHVEWETSQKYSTPKEIEEIIAKYMTDNYE